MRLRLALVLAAGILSLVAPADAGEGPPTLAGFEVTSPPPEHRADPSLKTYVFRVGPFELGPYGTLRHSDVVRPPPVAGSIVGMDVRVVDPRGEVIPQYIVMLHHDVFTNGGPDGRRRDGACPGRAVNERFYGTSEELRPLTLPRGYGYPTSPRDRWKMIWMIMNHRAPRRWFYVEYRVTVDPRPLTPVKPYWLSVVPCVADPQYTVPGGGRATVRRVRSFRLPVRGRIVAIGGHLHGGARGLVLSQPRCGNRTLYKSRPTYAPPGDPLYRVKPLLHEPDPKNMSWWQSATGWAVRPGERLKVTSLYDGRRPHMRVMGIAHVYLAADRSAPGGCAPAPRDVQVLGPSFSGGRARPPVIRLVLARLGRDGRARRISRPPGRVLVKRGGATVVVESYSFGPANLSIRRGASVRWRFRAPTQHDATLASGPRGFAGPYSRRGASYRHRFTVPGRYRIYCSLHPAYMSQYIRVRR
jgi:plastocyanin